MLCLPASSEQQRGAFFISAPRITATRSTMEAIAAFLRSVGLSPRTAAAEPRGQGQSAAHSARRPIELNVACMGRAGLGKTTALGALFGVRADTTGPVTHKAELPQPDDAHTRISLCVTDAPGFADDDDARHQVASALSGARAAMREHAFAMRRPHHRHAGDKHRDPRTHLVLYFVPPGRLPDLDRKQIDALLPYANVAVVAAKADSLVPDELEHYKEHVGQQLDDSSTRRRRRRSAEGVVDEEYLPFCVNLDDPQSSPVKAPVFAAIGAERSYSDWGRAGTARPEDSDLPELQRQILCSAGCEQLVAETDKRFSDVLERGELRSSIFTAKATGVGSIAGALFGLWIRQNYHRIQAGAEGRRAGAREGEPTPVPGAPVIAGMLLGAACGGGYHSLFGKLD